MKSSCFIISDMRILIDTREPRIRDKCQELAQSTSGQLIPILVQSLALGDMAVQNESGTDILLFERKSIPDLLASIKDGRYEEQSYRLIHASGLHPHHIVYVIEGAISQIRSPADKKIVLSAITSLSFFKGFSVMKTGSLQETAELVWSMATKIYKDFEKGKPVPHYSYPNREMGPSETVGVEPRGSGGDEQYSSLVKKVKQANITPENIGEIMLSQIPGVSAITAREILKSHHGSFLTWLKQAEKHPEILDTIYLTSGGSAGKRRKLGSNIIQNIRTFLLHPGGMPVTELSDISVLDDSPGALAVPEKDKGGCSRSESDTLVPL